MAGETPIAVIEGPKGKVEIFELWAATGHAMEYQLKFKSQTKSFNNLGEAYLEAGELAGTKT
jgi:hypothetical protein